jgi:hypothetical protein
MVSGSYDASPAAQNSVYAYDASFAKAKLSGDETYEKKFK